MQIIDAQLQNKQRSFIEPRNYFSDLMLQYLPFSDWTKRILYTKIYIRLTGTTVVFNIWTKYKYDGDNKINKASVI